MEIILLGSRLQFKNPITGQATRNVEEHYYARRIIANVDGVERQFRFTVIEMPYIVDEDEMIAAIESQLNAENHSTE